MPSTPSSPRRGQSARGNSLLLSISAAHGAISLSLKARTLARSRSAISPSSKLSAAYSLRIMMPLHGRATASPPLASAAPRAGQGPIGAVASWVMRGLGPILLGSAHLTHNIVPGPAAALAHANGLPGGGLARKPWRAQRRIGTMAKDEEEEREFLA